MPAPTLPTTSPLAEDLASLRQDIARLLAREAALRDRLDAAEASALPGAPLPRTPRPGWPIRRLPLPDGAAFARH